MDLQDMTYLIRAVDATEKIIDGVEAICGERIAEGPLAELSYITEIIRKYAAAVKNEKDDDRLWDILDDRIFEPEERAKMLMGINRYL